MLEMDVAADRLGIGGGGGGGASEEEVKFLLISIAALGDGKSGSLDSDGG